jgi:TrmH family RNA methyltransferase
MKMIITSAANEQIKNIINLKEKSKARKNSGTFTVEGIKMFAEVPREELVDVYISESFQTKNQSVLADVKYNVVSDSVFKKISDTVTPQGILAIVKQKKYLVDDIIKNRRKEGSCIVVLDRLQDPGNLGTIVRTGEGAGISGIILSSDCADIYNPKVIRSTMGSIFRVPFAISSDLPSDIEQLKKNGIVTYAAHLRGEEYNKEIFTKDCALLIGNEARGLSKVVAEKADRLIKIPMEGKVESLNAAVATAILMYEVKSGWQT